MLLIYEQLTALSGSWLSEPSYRRQAEGQARIVCHPLGERLPKITQNFLSLFHLFSPLVCGLLLAKPYPAQQYLPKALTSVFSI